MSPKKIKIICSILKWFARIWCFLVGLSIFVGALGIIIFSGWSEFTRIFSPFNVVNFFICFVLVLPALGAYCLSDYLSGKQSNNV